MAKNNKYAINKNDHTTQPKIVSTCKHKWGVIYDDFKRIFDYMSSIGNNTKYLPPRKKTSFNLLRS